jgi:hypothetical protein
MTVDLVIATVADLGQGRDASDASLEDVEALAGQVGLELCPAEVGPSSGWPTLSNGLASFFASP